MKLIFHKYQGTGNDFIIIDNRGRSWQEKLSTSRIAALCDRRFGIGGDGLILLSDPRASDFRMIYFNADGRESTMCGNGARCLVAFADYLGLVTDGHCLFEAIDGLHQAQLLPDGRISLEMSRPSGFRETSRGHYWVDTGSPHYVRFDPQSVSDLNVYAEGKALRHHPDYASIGGTNVNFVHELSHGHLQVRTYERGVEDETLSCGTGVTACAYAYLRGWLAPDARQGLRHIQIETPGGALEVHIDGLMGKKEQVLLCGPAVRVYGGEV
jgi:diaminopimelate epimerase